MWGRLLALLARIRLHINRGIEARQIVEARARFWAEVKEGEREADSRSHP